MLTFQQFAEKPPGSFLIPTLLHQNIDRVAILVNGPQEVTRFVTDLDEHFVAMPDVTCTTLSFFQCTSVSWAKLATPLANGFIRDNDPAFSE